MSPFFSQSMIKYYHMDELDKMLNRLMFLLQAGVAFFFIYFAIKEIMEDVEIQIALKRQKQLLHRYKMKLQRFYEAYLDPQPLINEASNALEDGNSGV
jgi:hypothetical protein